MPNPTHFIKDLRLKSVAIQRWDNKKEIFGTDEARSFFKGLEGDSKTRDKIRDGLAILLQKELLTQYVDSPDKNYKKDFASLQSCKDVWACPHFKVEILD